MARHLLGVVPFLVLAGLFLAATAQEATPSPEAYDAQKEIEKLKGWKTYLTAEVDKHKAELDKAQAALKAEQARTTELTSLAEQWKKAAADAETKAAAAETKAAAAEAKAAEVATKLAAAEALASSHARFSTELSAQLEPLRKDLAAAKTKASAHAAAADASNGEAALLRKQLSEAVAERQSLDDRVTELASAAAKAGGLRGHALAIYDILLEEVARHHEKALNYANEKLPGFKAKVAEVHATVSSKMPNVSDHVGKFVNNVDGELRPWLRQTLGSVAALKPYSEDPVLLQGLTYVIIGAPVLLLLLPVLSITFRLVSRRPSSSSSSGRGSESKSARRNKKKQG